MPAKKTGEYRRRGRKKHSKGTTASETSRRSLAQVKCPNCGAIYSAFLNACPSCGYKRPVQSTLKVSAKPKPRSKKAKKE